MNLQTSIDTWDGLKALLHSWYQGETPVGAVLMAIFTASLRIAHRGGGWKKMMLEVPLCGALTLTFYSALAYFDLPKSLCVAIGGSIGFLGVDALRTFILRFVSNHLGVTK